MERGERAIEGGGEDFELGRDGIVQVAFQGFLWDINSFDQEGVQLGKVLSWRSETERRGGRGG